MSLLHAQRGPHWLGEIGLSRAVRDALLPSYAALADHIVERRRHAEERTLIVGIQGPQGAGKSTLAHILKRLLIDFARLRVETLSIDDLYLGREARADLAQRVHPLFATRGVPGTHNVTLGVRTLTALEAGHAVRVPRFDKGRDEPLAPSAWPRVDARADVVLFEGLWVGLPPIPDADLSAPLNELERCEDQEGIWRRHANAALANEYPALFAPCKLLVHLQVPSFACSMRWRSRAEQELRARLAREGADTSRLMDAAGLARFFQHYERFIEHAMRVMPERADVVLTLDESQRIASLKT